MEKHRAITAQVASGETAFVAFTKPRQAHEPLGETVAEIWRTTDRGRTWTALPWNRALRVFASRGMFALWPPMWVNKMWLSGSSLEIEVREDQGLGSPTHPIWRGTWAGRGWRVRFDRWYELEVDGPIVANSLELNLPGITTPPLFGPYR